MLNWVLMLHISPRKLKITQITKKQVRYNGSEVAALFAQLVIQLSPDVDKKSLFK